MHKDLRAASAILGTGRYVPARVVTNHDLEKMVETSDAWISDRTGIRERRVAAEGELTSDMGAAAARAALESAGLTAADLDMIIVGTVTGDMPMPACAAFIQEKIGARNVPAFDIAAACAGFIYGLTVADQFVRTGHLRHVLVIGVELLSRFLNWEDRTTCVLFGDGAGAVIVGPAPAPAADGLSRGILATKIHTDGSLANILTIPAGGSRTPATQQSVEQRQNKVQMNGREVFKIASKNLPTASLEVLKDAGFSPKDVDWVVAHQANMRILTQVAQRLELPLERFVLNIERYGNTSSASVPIALDEAVRDGRIRPGHTVLMCALGAGISWGSALVRM